MVSVVELDIGKLLLFLIFVLVGSAFLRALPLVAQATCRDVRLLFVPVRLSDQILP